MINNKENQMIAKPPKWLLINANWFRVALMLFMVASAFLQLRGTLNSY
jgi:hypothetical protein